MKHASNLFHLVIGVVLLAGGIFAFRLIGQHGKNVWEREKSVVAKPRPKATSDVDDLVAAASGGGAKSDVARDGEDAPGPSAAVALQTIDRIGPGTVGSPRHFLHKRLVVLSYKTIEFELPAHTRHPALEGSYLCVDRNGIRDASGAAAVELMLMNEDEFSKFNAETGGTVMQTQVPASHADIDWDLKETYGDSRNYYLVFRNASRKRGATPVEVDFAVKAEE